MSVEKQTHTTRLYRIENQSITDEPDGVTSHEDLVGQWFSPNVDTATGYLRKSTQTTGRGSVPIDGAKVIVAEVPTIQLAELHVSRHPIGRDMDV